MTAQGGSEVRRGSREEWRLLREKFEHSNSDLNRRRLAVSYINDYFPIGDSTDFFVSTSGCCLSIAMKLLAYQIPSGVGCLLAHFK